MGPIEIGPRACLRTSSRVMMMSTVGERSTLLEGTLVLAGDSSAPSSTWNGWPGEAVAPAALAYLRLQTASVAQGQETVPHDSVVSPA